MGGYFGSLYFLNITDNSIAELSSNIERPNINFGPPVVDINNNFYYINMDSYLVGYKREANSVSQIFNEDAGEYLCFDIVLIEGKMYFPAREKLIEVSFE